MHITLTHPLIKLWYNQFKETKRIDTKINSAYETSDWPDILTQYVQCRCWASFCLNFINFFSIKCHNKHKMGISQQIIESGCHPHLVLATTVHLKKGENEYLSKLGLLKKQYSTCQRLYIDVLPNLRS